MAKKTVEVDIHNIEYPIRRCIINPSNGGRKYYTGECKNVNVKGLFMEQGNIFFALYSSCVGPVIYYGKEYTINKDLHISITDIGSETHRFVIVDYDIDIEYKDSEFLDYDSYSTREWIDIFYIIEQGYKTDEFYDWYTLKE